MEDDIPGDAGLVPANLALNNPIGRQPRDRRMELPWARDGWHMDDKGNLVSERGERLKLDQYQRNFWRKREKNLRRDEDRRRKQLDKARELAAAAQERMEKRKRERSEEASRSLVLHKKGKHENEDPVTESEKEKEPEIMETNKIQEGWQDPYEQGISPSEKAKREYENRQLDKAKARKEEKARKKEEKEKQRELDAEYWKDPEVMKMTGRVTSAMPGRKLTQVDITLISQEHVKQKREKLIKKGDMAKARKVNTKKIGLGVHGLRIHLSQEEGWEWWKELVEGMPPTTDEEGTYSYKFLKPGEEAFKHFLVHIPDDYLLDREAAPGIFKDEMLSTSPIFEEFHWEARFVRSNTRGPRPVATMRLIIPTESVESVMAYLPGKPGRIQYGIETHELHPFKPGSRPRPRVPDGVGAGDAGRFPPPPPSCPSPP